MREDAETGTRRISIEIDEDIDFRIPDASCGLVIA
jgi:hypothetical protein